MRVPGKHWRDSCDTYTTFQDVGVVTDKRRCSFFDVFLQVYKHRDQGRTSTFETRELLVHTTRMRLCGRAFDKVKSSPGGR